MVAAVATPQKVIIVGAAAAAVAAVVGVVVTAVVVSSPTQLTGVNNWPAPHCFVGLPRKTLMLRNCRVIFDLTFPH